MTREQLEKGLKLQEKMKIIECEVDNYQDENIKTLHLNHNDAECHLRISDKEVIQSILSIALTHKCKEFNKLKKEFEEL